MDWQRLPASRWGLRPLGVLLLLGAYSAGHHVLALTAGHVGSPPALAYLLGMIAFLCFSAGCPLLIHGHHLFDRVEIADRWKHSSSARETPSADE